MSISSTGIYGSAKVVNSDIFQDVEDLKEQATTLSTSYLTTTEEHRNSINDISGNKIPALESDISSNLSKINDISDNKIPALASEISSNLSKINDISDTYVCICAAGDNSLLTVEGYIYIYI